MIPNFESCSNPAPSTHHHHHLSNSPNNNPYGTSQQHISTTSTNYFSDHGIPPIAATSISSPFNDAALNQQRNQQPQNQQSEEKRTLDDSSKYMIENHTNTNNKGFLSSSYNHHNPSVVSFKDNHHPHLPFYSPFQTTTFHQRFNPAQFGMSSPGYFPSGNPYGSSVGLASFYDRMYEMEAKLPLDYARVWLDHQTLWRRFSVCGNEMIITKMGR